MRTDRIRKWADAVGVGEAAKRLGVTTTTLSRYMSGETKPPVSRAVLLGAIISEWERGEPK